MSRVMLFSLFIACIACTATEAVEPVSIKTGFLTGNSYLELSDSAKRGYAVGFLEGVFVSPMFGAPKSELQWIEQCTVGMTDKQVAAVFDKFLHDNPSRWHEQMNVLAWIAMKQGCK